PPPRRSRWSASSGASSTSRPSSPAATGTSSTRAPPRRPPASRWRRRSRPGRRPRPAPPASPAASADGAGSGALKGESMGSGTVGSGVQPCAATRPPRPSRMPAPPEPPRPSEPAPGRWRVRLENMAAERPVRLAFYVFLVAAAVVVALSLPFYLDDLGGFLENLAAEAHGMVLDLLVIGWFIFWLQRQGERRVRANRYREEIEDFLGWRSHEATLRIAGNVRRLNRLGFETPLKLTEAFVQGANLAGADLRQADLWGDDLTNAVLQGTRLDRANLAGARLQGAAL